MRVLIVGHGRMGRFHAKAVRDAGDNPVTLDPHAEADYRFWDQAPHVDAAIIVCPIEHLHVNALHATNIGLKVLVEKPAAATLEQAQHLASINPDMAVGYLERGNPVVAGLAKHCPNPQLIRFVRSGPRTRDGAWLDVASHDIDLCHHYFPGAAADFTVAHSPWPVRVIHADGYTANLVTRSLHRDGDLIEAYPMHDLLAHQYQAFKAGTPLATISDAVRVHETLLERTQARAA